MKRFSQALALSLVFAFSAFATFAQSHQETLQKTFTSNGSKQLVNVHNPHGSVTVEAFAGNQIEIKVEKKITAQTAADLERGKREVEVIMEQRGDTVQAYVVAPQLQWCGNRYGGINFSDEDAYAFDLVIQMKVPRQVNLNISTVRGDVFIKDVQGNIQAHSHQSLKLVNVAGKTDASAHHGNLEASYSAPIPANSSFRTHHGDVRLYLPGQPNADIEYDSYHGDLYTDFPDVQVSPAPVTKLVSSQGEGKQYKLEKKKSVRLGKGGMTLKFHSHHGSFYLLTKK